MLQKLFEEPIYFSRWCAFSFLEEPPVGLPDSPCALLKDNAGHHVRSMTVDMFGVFDFIRRLS